MQIIEKFFIHVPTDYYWQGEKIPQTVCDEVNFKYTPEQAINYLKGFNEACKADKRLVQVQVRIEYSTDPIGTLIKSPAIGGVIRRDIILGNVDSIMGELHQKFIGYLDQQKNVVIPVDFYSKM